VEALERLQKGPASVLVLEIVRGPSRVGNKGVLGKDSHPSRSRSDRETKTGDGEESAGPFGVFRKSEGEGCLPGGILFIGSTWRETGAACKTTLHNSCGGVKLK